jgi:hypothetical protein
VTVVVVMAYGIVGHGFSPSSEQQHKLPAGCEQDVAGAL